jgi:hypothetical protein
VLDLQGGLQRRCSIREQSLITEHISAIIEARMATQELRRPRLMLKEGMYPDARVDFDIVRSSEEESIDLAAHFRRNEAKAAWVIERWLTSRRRVHRSERSRITYLTADEG